MTLTDVALSSSDNADKSYLPTRLVLDLPHYNLTQIELENNKISNNNDFSWDGLSMNCQKTEILENITITLSLEH